MTVSRTSTLFDCYKMYCFTVVTDEKELEDRKVQAKKGNLSENFKWNVFKYCDYNYYELLNYYYT